MPNRKNRIVGKYMFIFKLQIDVYCSYVVREYMITLCISQLRSCRPVRWKKHSQCAVACHHKVGPRKQNLLLFWLRYCLKTTSQTNDYLCSYRAETCMRLERRNALNLSLYSAVESVSKLGSRRKSVCG